jgi:hemerythrin-like domain-containing protein
MAAGTQDSEVDMSTDAITLLKDDHKQVRATFREFERAGDDLERKGELVASMIELLTAHTYLENNGMYPEVQNLLPDLESDVLESYEEHHVADLLIAELASLDPSEDRFEAKTTVLIEIVRHHIEEEEQDWFPKVRAALSRSQLQDIGARMLELKQHAPKSPATKVAAKTSRPSVPA